MAPAVDSVVRSQLLAAGGNAVIPPTVWAIISFLVVLAILWKKVLPIILDAMDKRAREIRDALSAAENARAEAEQMMQRHQADLDAARHEARQIIEEGKADAQRVKAQIIDDAQREAQQTIERVRREIDLAKQAALEQLHLRSVQLSFELARDLIGKSLDPQDHQALIDERIRALSSNN